MKDKNTEELLQKFRKLEEKLVEVLKIEPLDIDESKQPSVIKREIKAYIQKVKAAKAVFDKYEEVAHEIEKLAEEKETEFSSEVVNLREEMVDEVEVTPAVVKVVKKKKNNASVKEF